MLLCISFGVSVIAGCSYFPVLGVLLFVMAIWTARSRPVADFEHGTARFASLRDLVRRKYLCRQSGMVIGRVNNDSSWRAPLVWETLTQYPAEADEQAVRTVDALGNGAAKTAPILLPNEEIVHVSVYGRTSSGKSTGHAIGNLWIDRASVIVSDVKPELALATARHRADVLGQEIVCIAPLGGAPPGFPTHSFNPFSVVNLNSNHILAEGIHFAKALIRPDKQDHNPFFIKSTIIVLDAILSFLLCHAIPSQCTLQKLRELTVDPDKLRSAAEMMQQSSFAGGYLRSKGAQLQALTGKTLMDVLATLNTQLFWIDSLAVEEATRETTFDIQKLLDGRMSIYLIFPTDRVEDYASLIRVWITAFAHAIFAAGINRPHPIRFYFDEASLLGQDMPVLERMLTKGRAYGIRMNFYWQSVHQIQEVFLEHQAQVFREQMSVEQFLEVSNYQTAKEISQWIGQTTLRIASGSSTHGSSGSQTSSNHPSSTSGWSSSTTGSWQKSGRALIQPEELLQLPADVTVVLKPQCPPILARKLKSYRPEDRAEILAIVTGESPAVLRVKRMRWLVIGTVIICFAALIAVTNESSNSRKRGSSRPKPRITSTVWSTSNQNAVSE